MNKIKLLAATGCVLLCALLYAQPQRGERPAPPKMKTPEEIAKSQADMMKSEVDLTDKQYKKVYQLIKKDHEYRRSQMEERFSGGPGGPGGMGGPGGPGGMGGPMGGGMPPQGDMQRGPRPEGGPGMGGPGGDIVTEEYLEKQEAKLKKILTEEQYNKWRSKHPAEHLELPPLATDTKGLQE